MIITPNFCWDDHINSICKNFARRLHALRILKGVLNKNKMLQVYHCLLGTLFDYAAPLFMTANNKNNKQMDLCIKRAHRLICGPNCKELCINAVENRRMSLAMKKFTKILFNENHPLHSLLPHKSPRSERLIIPVCASNKRCQSFEIKCAIELNK